MKIYGGTHEKLLLLYDSRSGDFPISLLNDWEYTTDQGRSWRQRGYFSPIFLIRITLTHVDRSRKIWVPAPHSLYTTVTWNKSRKIWLLIVYRYILQWHGTMKLWSLTVYHYFPQWHGTRKTWSLTKYGYMPQWHRTSVPLFFFNSPFSSLML